ncbi:sel1 repeat family protein [Photobacterium sp. SDRW27]|uniref:tetratricopeptide repeat protein n=1 Tax=Photobacterium obscurum TaxID=2829490 RepID=UPI00224447D1|nr:sel1 repeat family protein [Photobacterium obscurum]MCW8330966.1 sel1 repeat family protein [Photobacterium obscurum]
MNNKKNELCLEEIEEKLLNTSVSDEFLGILKESSTNNADITELMYQYYLNENDYQNAIYYLELGDKFDDRYAQFYLAALYQQGKHCPQNEQRALQLLEKSANNGEAEAQYELGASLVLAGNSQEDLEQGTYWLNESFLNGNDDSKQLLEFVGLQ